MRFPFLRLRKRICSPWFTVSVTGIDSTFKRLVKHFHEACFVVDDVGEDWTLVDVEPFNLMLPHQSFLDPVEYVVLLEVVLLENSPELSPNEGVVGLL